ncbi:hypothetical protein OSTOST_18514, partial [Ostertagia ostertagi]
MQQLPSKRTRTEDVNPAVDQGLLVLPDHQGSRADLDDRALLAYPGCQGCHHTAMDHRDSPGKPEKQRIWEYGSGWPPGQDGRGFSPEPKAHSSSWNPGKPAKTRRLQDPSVNQFLLAIRDHLETRDLKDCLVALVFKDLPELQANKVRKVQMEVMANQDWMAVPGILDLPDHLDVQANRAFVPSIALLMVVSSSKMELVVSMSNLCIISYFLPNALLSVCVDNKHGE